MTFRKYLGYVLVVGTLSNQKCSFIILLSASDSHTQNSIKMTIVFRLFKGLTRLSHRKTLCTAQGIDESTRFQLNRTYKDFGHAREKEPFGSAVWIGFIIFFMCIGSFRFVA